ncbi:MAG: TonB-dependent receptor [Janthinobacterium lividum]
MYPPKRRPISAVVAVTALVSIAGTAAAQPASTAATADVRLDLPQVDVIGVTPLQGAGLDRDKVPAQTAVLTRDTLSRDGYADTLRALNENVGGLTLDEAQGNPYQPNLIFRGFEASPLVGNAQGLAVYVNGTRFNQPFGDTTNWDLIPDIAIDGMDVSGSNPAFGLNALGGSISVRTKNGFTYQGGQAEILGGSFGRIRGSVQYGKQVGDVAAYFAATGLNEDGWRDHSPSQLRQFFGDLGWRNDRSEVHLNVLGAINNLVGNGTTPVQLLAASRSAVFTYPDETRNKYIRVALTGTTEINDLTSIQANAYYSNLSQRTRNGDAAEVESCDNDRTIVCVEDGPPLTDRAGNNVPNFIRNSPYFTQYGIRKFRNGGPYSFLNQTATDTNGYGVQAQLTRTGEVFGRSNHFVVGASYDGGATEFTASTSIGGLGLDRGWFGPGIVIDQADGSISPVRVHTTNNYYGVFLTDTLDVTSRLAVTASGRFNNANITLRDQIGTDLNGEHSYSRFNPAVGFTYKLLPSLTVYGGYSEANRTPTPAELSCASPAAPCSLTNFFVGDPDLKQVVAHTFEAGLRGRVDPWTDATLNWHAGYFHTDSDDDILFVSSETVGRAFFRNVGRTRRQGVEAGATLQAGPMRLYANYAFTDATFRTPFTLSSENNPLADDNGNIQVQSGNRLPGIPRHLAKLGADYQVTPAWSVGTAGIVSSGRPLFGDEANLTPTTGAYGVLNVHTAYQVTSNVQLFGLVENAFNTRYETFGTFSPVAPNTPILQVPNASNTRSLSPAPPIAGYAGLRVTF